MSGDDPHSTREVWDDGDPRRPDPCPRTLSLSSLCHLFLSLHFSDPLCLTTFSVSGIPLDQPLRTITKTEQTHLGSREKHKQRFRGRFSHRPLLPQVVASQGSTSTPFGPLTPSRDPEKGLFQTLSFSLVPEHLGLRVARGEEEGEGGWPLSGDVGN